MSNGTARYSDQELAEFKAIIDVRLEKARSQVEKLQEQLFELSENNDNGYDLDDFSSTDQEKELLQTMVIRQQKHIRDLENALIRIRNKAYGVCEVTGKLIDKKRLIAVPTTSKSLEGKQILAAPVPKEVEKKEKPARPHKPVITSVIRKKSSTKPPAPSDHEEDDLKDLDMTDYDDDDDWKFIPIDDDMADNLSDDSED